MPTLSCFYGIVVQMFFSDYAPPHFHALYGEEEALVDIRTLAVIRGKLPGRALALVGEWANQHRAELMEAWNRCAANQPPSKIPPLE
jgi:hypothetical protein